MNPTSQFLLGVKVYLDNCTWKSTCDDIFRGRSQGCQYGHIGFECEVGLYQSGGSRGYCEPQNLDSLLSTRVIFNTLLRSSYSIISPSCFSPECSDDEYFTKCSEHCWFSIPDSQRDWLMEWNYERLHCYPVEPWLWLLNTLIVSLAEPAGRAEACFYSVIASMRNDWSWKQACPEIAAYFTIFTIFTIYLLFFAPPQLLD